MLIIYRYAQNLRQTLIIANVFALANLHVFAIVPGSGESAYIWAQSKSSTPIPVERIDAALVAALVADMR